MSTSAPTGAERRIAERRPLRAPAQVVLSGDRVFDVRTMDISASGMAIIATANPRPGTAFVLRFAIPSKQQGQAGTPIEVEARVVHSVFSSDENGFKIGLSFTQLPPASAEAIVHYIGG